MLISGCEYVWREEGSWTDLIIRDSYASTFFQLFEALFKFTCLGLAETPLAVICVQTLGQIKIESITAY